MLIQNKTNENKFYKGKKVEKGGVSMAAQEDTRTRRWFFERLAENFRTREAFAAWLWGYVPVFGGASLWSAIVFVMIFHFVKECVEQFAQSHATYAHNRTLSRAAEELRRRY